MAEEEIPAEFQTNNGEPLHIGDFVCLFPADPNAELYIARIDKMYRDEEGKKLIQIRWYYRRKDLQHEPPSKPMKNEIYYTNYFDCQLVESVALICKVFTKSEYFKLNEAQRRFMAEDNSFFYEYAYSAENGSFTKMSASEDAHLRRSFRKQDSSNRTKDSPLKVLIDALLDLEQALPKDAIAACWTEKRSTWIAKVKESKTVQCIAERVLHLEECLQLIRGTDGKIESKYLAAWKKAVMADSSPESLLQNIEHLKVFVLRRHGNTGKKRKRYWHEHENNKDKLPLLQDVVCEELDDSDKNGGRIKEGGIYEMNNKNLPPKAPVHLRSIRAVLVTEKTNVLVCVKFPGNLALRKYFGMDKNIKQTTPHPDLDEQFVMHPNLAERVLSRQIPSTEYVPQRNLESFWLIVGSGTDEERKITTPNPPKLSETPSTSAERAYPADATEDVKLATEDVKLATEDKGQMKFEETMDVNLMDNVCIKWGQRRKVIFNRKHRSMEERAMDLMKNRPKRRRYAISEDDMAASKIPGDKSSMLRLPKDMQGRWTGERYRAAQLKLLAIMHDKGAVPGKPILRPALREEARKHIGDTGLLDHLLKHMTDTVITNGERFRRRHNAEGAMEYWLEAAGLMEIRKEAGVQDPWWIPPPGWKLGDKVPLNGYGTGMTPLEAEEMKTIKEELIKVQSELFSLKSMNVIEGKLTPQKEDDGVLKEMLKDLETEVKCLKKDVGELQIKSFRRENNLQVEVQTSQSVCLVENTNLAGAKMLRCNIVDRVEKIETETHKFFQEMESNHRAEKKQFEDHITKITATLERMQEEMNSVLKSANNTKETATKEPSSEQSLSTATNRCEANNINVAGSASNSKSKDKADDVELSSESKACKQACVHQEREQKARTGFRLCKPEGTFIWPSMAPKTTTRVPLDDVFSPRQLQPTPPSPSTSVQPPIPSEYTSHKMVKMDAKDNRDFTLRTGNSSTVVVYRSRSKAAMRNGQNAPAQDACDTELSLSPKSPSQYKGAVEVQVQAASPAKQKELISMYVSHLATPKLPWAQMMGGQISKLGRSPVPEFMGDQVVLPVLSHESAATYNQGGGGGGYYVDVPEASKTPTPQSPWLGLALAPPAASSATHNA